MSQSRSRRPPRHRVRRSGVRRRSIITTGGGTSETTTVDLSCLMAEVSVRGSPRCTHRPETGSTSAHSSPAFDTPPRRCDFDLGLPPFGDDLLRRVPLSRHRLLGLLSLPTFYDKSPVRAAHEPERATDRSDGSRASTDVARGTRGRGGNPQASQPGPHGDLDSALRRDGHPRRG